MQHFAALSRVAIENARDLAPFLLVVVAFQLVVVREPMPELGTKLPGGALVLGGLTLFVRGLSMSLFPLGKGLAETFARRGNLALLLAFAFAIGFGSTVAEPALAAVVARAAEAAPAAGLVSDGTEGVERYALLLHYAASAAVGLAVLLGCWRIVMGWPAFWFVLGLYGVIAVLALAFGTPLLGVAFDARAAATSAINIPLIAALGVGLAGSIRGRRPPVDGFGLVALPSLMPMLAIILGAAVLQ
jgi:hypothetical protein